MPRAFSRPHWRGLATLSDDEIRRKMDDFNDLFITAREEIEFAGESRETTYFNEEAEAAKEAVEEAVAVFEGLLKEVDEDKRREIMRGRWNSSRQNLTSCLSRTITDGLIYGSFSFTCADSLTVAYLGLGLGLKVGAMHFPNPNPNPNVLCIRT
ncbi:unnamed protein product [Discosporangium mesarthrocarpum]